MDQSDRNDRLTPAADLLSSGLGAIGGDIGRIVAAWPAIVGERLAAVTTPAGLRQGTLRVRCASASWAQALSGMELDVLDRIAARLRPGTVTRLHARAGGPAPRVEEEPEPQRPLRELDPADRAQLESLVETIDDPDLRARLLHAADASMRRRRNR